MGSLYDIEREIPAKNYFSWLNQKYRYLARHPRESYEL